MAVFLLCFFLLAIVGDLVSGQDLRLPSAEQEAAYLALESIDPVTDWRSLYSGDLCISGPHGVVCDLFIGTGDSSVHITELNFGFVSDYSSNPNCSPNATLPLVLARFPFLRKIFFYNCFTVSNASIDNLFSNLPSAYLEEVVFIGNTALSGHLSSTIGNLRRLRRLIVSGNGISDRIPTEIGKLQTLTQLDLSMNLIGGSIPKSITNLKMLKILDLSGNRISGSIPAEIGRLEELIKLDLNSNAISGLIPAGMNLMKNLEFLDLSRNCLTGGVPTALGEMMSLKEVYLSGNAELGGRIPEIWENLRGILGIGMSGIGLVGNIPPSMGVYLEKVSYLGLDGNFLEGTVPEQFKRLESSASEINLENNRLVGRVPFSAGFVMRVGGNLKVGGNPKLCLGEDVARHVRGRGSVGMLDKCNISDIPHSVPHTASGGPLLAGNYIWVLCLSFLLCFFNFIFTNYR